MSDIVLLIIAFFIAGIIQGVFGFGFVMGSTLLLVNQMDLGSLVFINLAMSILTSLVAMFSLHNIKAIRTNILFKLIISSTIGIVIGLFLMDKIDAPTLKKITLAVIFVAALLSLSKSKALFGSSAFTWVGGLISGVLTPTTGINGPPVALHLNARLVNKSEIRITMLAYLLLIMAFGLISLMLKPGFKEPSWSTLGIASLPTLAGYGVGLFLFKKLSDSSFQKITTIFLIASSVAALINLILN